MIMGKLVVLLVVSASVAIATKQRTTMTANPVRKVVKLLQKMEKSVAAESEREQELFDKFMCYCKTSGGDLSGSIESAQTKIPQLKSDIESAEAEKKGVDEDLKEAKKDREDAKAAMEAATAQREKEQTDYDTMKADLVANIDAVARAVAALEKGAAGGFLQTSAAGVLRRLLDSNRQDLPDTDREQVAAFLSGNPNSMGYAAQSEEITGILKQMGDEMAKALSDATAVEKKAVKIYQELMDAKVKEVGALTKQIEQKITKSGELAVSIAQMENDEGDMSEALAQDQKFLAELEKSCGTKEKEWKEICKLRKEELAALADTIKILNNDDALELFKKTLPAPGSASFMQVAVGRLELRSHAHALLMRGANKAGRQDGARLKFIALALNGKKIGFEKIVAMIDELLETLKQEQNEDDSKKDYCNKELDAADDKKKVLEKQISDSEAAIEAAKEGIAMLTEEIEALIVGIKKLDKSVSAATEQRKEENAEFKELMTSDTAAKELLKMAANRMNKFYNPKLYQPPAKTERSAMDAISEDVGGGAALVQVRMHQQDGEAPPPPPEVFDAYSKQGQESSGVMQMLNLLITDLDKEMTEAEVEEKNAQVDYEELMKDSAEKRAADSKSLSEKESTKAELEGDLQAHKEDLKGYTKDLAATVEYIHGLHLECDFLLKYFDVRKEMRASEADALEKAKAVLAGADYSLLQTGRHTMLRGA